MILAMTLHLLSYKTSRPNGIVQYLIDGCYLRRASVPINHTVLPVSCLGGGHSLPAQGVGLLDTGYITTHTLLHVCDHISVSCSRLQGAVFVQAHAFALERCSHLRLWCRAVLCCSGSIFCLGISVLPAIFVAA